MSKYVVIARYYVCKRNLKGFTTTALCAPFQRIQEVLRNVFGGYSIAIDTKELSYEFVTLRYLQEKAQQVILIFWQTTMSVKSHMQMENK